MLGVNFGRWKGQTGIDIFVAQVICYLKFEISDFSLRAQVDFEILKFEIAYFSLQCFVNLKQRRIAHKVLYKFSLNQHQNFVLLGS